MSQSSCESEVTTSSQAGTNDALLERQELSTMGFNITKLPNICQDNAGAIAMTNFIQEQDFLGYT